VINLISRFVQAALAPPATTLLIQQDSNYIGGAISTPYSQFLSSPTSILDAPPFWAIAWIVAGFLSMSLSVVTALRPVVLCVLTFTLPAFLPVSVSIPAVACKPFLAMGHVVLVLACQDFLTVLLAVLAKIRLPLCGVLIGHSLNL